MAFWTCHTDQVSKIHSHPFDEYTTVVSGQYIAIIDGKEIVLNPGDEIFVPIGTSQGGRCIAGTRTISAFGGKRIRSEKNMIRLRPFKLIDIEYLLKWTDDEYAFAQWCANKFTYPLTKEQLMSYYQKYENDDSAWIMTALDKKGTPVGHLLMRKADYQMESIHLGFVILDSKIRGKGYGKEMISLAIKYSFDILKVEKVTLAVFDNNPVAQLCYKAAGFVNVQYHEAVFPFGEEKWGVYDMAISNNDNWGIS